MEVETTQQQEAMQQQQIQALLANVEEPLQQNVFSVMKIFVTKSPVFRRKRLLTMKSSN